jgi:hypothetical protein
MSAATDPATRAAYIDSEDGQRSYFGDDDDASLGYDAGQDAVTVVDEGATETPLLVPVDGSGAVEVARKLNLSNSDAIQDSGTDAIQFDGSQNLTYTGGQYVKDGNPVVAGNDSQINIAGTTPEYQFLANSLTDRLGFAHFTNDANPALFEVAKSRNGSVGAGTAVQSGDNLLYLSMRGDDGTDLSNTAARLTAAVDDTVSTGVVPGRVVLSTADASGSLTEALRIDSNQRVGIQTTPSTVLDTSGVAENWRINTGQAIERGNGNRLIQTTSNTTFIFDESDDARMSLKSGANSQFLTGGEGNNWEMFDEQQSAVGWQYMPGSTGTFELTNADMKPDSAGNRKVGTSSTYFNEMHATSFVTHSPESRSVESAMESVEQYVADGYGSMEMEEMLADLVTLVKEQQNKIEQLTGDTQ